MWHSIHACVCLYLVKLVSDIHCITYLKGITTPKLTTRKIPLEKWLEKNNLRLAPYGNQEFTKIFKQYKHVVRAKYYCLDVNSTDTSLGAYVRAQWVTTTIPASRRPLKKEKIKMGKLKLVKENIAELEEKLALTTIGTPRTTEPTTAPYTGSTLRKSVSPYYEHVLPDQNWFLKPKKRLRRSVDSKNNGQENEPLHKESRRNVDGFLFQHENYRHPFEQKIDNLKKGVETQRHKRNSPNEIIMKHKENCIVDIETNVNRLKRELDEMKCHYKRQNSANCHHKIKRRPGVVNRVKRALGSIVRRPTKRPYLSRNFKAQSAKRFQQEKRYVQMMTDMLKQITIAPEFLHLKCILDTWRKNNLSTLYYVYKDVAYFGSVPPNVLVDMTTPSTLKPMTYEMGATQILSDKIFDDENDKKSPDVEIPALDLAQVEEADNQTVASLIEHTEITVDDVTTGKQKRTRKKKNNEMSDGEDVTKKTRTKRKTTVAQNNSGETKIEEEANQEEVNKPKAKKRKARSLDTNKLVLEMFPHVLAYVHLHHSRYKRDASGDNKEGKQESNPRIEHVNEEKSFNPFKKLKETFKNSKDHFASFCREKKEALIDFPRRAKYIAREMYLDGKFFVQELPHVPSRIKADLEEKKAIFSIITDIMKLVMPIPSTTAVGEKGGTTPEPKIVDDPKQYVKNPEDYLTPNLYETTKTTFVKREAPSKANSVDETIEESRTEKKIPTSELQRTEHTKRRTEKRKVVQSKATTTETIILGNYENTQTLDSNKKNKEPVLVETQEEPLSKKTYVTKILDPDTDGTNDPYKSHTKTTSIVNKLFDKVNDKETFESLQSSFKDKEYMNNIFKNADRNNLKNMFKDMNPMDLMKNIKPDTIDRMGKMVKEMDPETISKMQDFALDIFAKKGGSSASGAPPAVPKNT